MNLINGDCLPAMREMEDNQFDLAIVDPPYGIGWDGEKEGMSAGKRKDGSIRTEKTWKNRHLKKTYTKKEWDTSKPDAEYFTELFRVSKNQIIWGGNYFSEYLPSSGGCIVWDKGVSDGMTLSQAELAWTQKTNSIKIAKILWAGYKKQEQEFRIHPTQKPVALYKWLLSNYANTGDTILDTHLGSGSSVIACLEMGFEITGYELDAEYFEAMQQRIKIHQSQGRMF